MTPTAVSQDSLIGCLPRDWRESTLVGRMDFGEGPTPVAVLDGQIFDLSRVAPTVAELLALPEVRLDSGALVGPLESLLLRPTWTGADGHAPRLLAPIDLQCVKASGVTFAVSAVERVIEERARGDAAQADRIRQALQDRVGADIALVKPGSDQAQALKAALIVDGLWSQYLEVAIGPDAEIFTKAPVLGAVGWGDDVGVRADSAWNNPEPEIVLVCDPEGTIKGATLGNDVNLRDIEGRSALLLGKAKDNNASAALGPFIRLFDNRFTLDDVRQADLRLEVRGEDGFHLEGGSSMRLISRDPTELVAQAFGENHRYPDGFALFLGTLFAPIEDRDTPGRGFTHKRGDMVRIKSPRLGALLNRVAPCGETPPWRMGIGALMRNLAGRGLLPTSISDSRT